MINLKTYDIIYRAIIEGAEDGWNRAHKYEPIPSKEIIIDNFVKSIMISLDEIIDFEKN